MKRTVLIILCLILARLVSAQELEAVRLYRFSGFVKNSVDSTYIPNVHVLNISKGTGTVSALDGSFELMVRDNDTLKYSSIGFEDRYLMINNLIRRENIMVFLNRDTVLMEEFLVHPLGPRRFFKYEFMALELPEPVFEFEINENFFRPKKGEEPIPPTGINFTGPVQGLYNLFNKTARTSRKLRKNRRKYDYEVLPMENDSIDSLKSEKSR